MHAQRRLKNNGNSKKKHPKGSNRRNSSHDIIKFTIEIADKEVTFMDTRVKVDSVTNEVYTELYIPRILTHRATLHMTPACHPKLCKTGGPYGEFLKLSQMNFRNCHKIRGL